MTPRYAALVVLAGALTLFAWETLSNAALPWHRMTMQTFADSNAAVAAIRAHAPDNGLYYDARGVIAAVKFLPDMSSRAALLIPMLLKQIGLDVVVGALFLVAMMGLPRATPKQYAAIFAVAALGISASTFGSNWNWWGYPAAWTAVQVIDRTIGFALMGLVMGAMASRAMPRSTTDEWGGVRAQGGLSPTSRNSSVRG
jgi:hypothetical protein